VPFTKQPEVRGEDHRQRGLPAKEPSLRQEPLAFAVDAKPAIAIRVEVELQPLVLRQLSVSVAQEVVKVCSVLTAIEAEPGLLPRARKIVQENGTPLAPVEACA
jgi:hypothetical protein